MENVYKPLSERTPDRQYRDRLAQIILEGERVEDTPQGTGAYTCFGTLAPMVFDLANGVPLITERKIGFWRKPIAEIIAFMNGVRTVQGLEEFGCDFWKDYADKGADLGLTPGDLGPGSYGAAFHDFETPYGDPLNQFAQVVEQITKYPSMRTHLVTPWKPYYTARGENRKVIVAPCHGWLHFRVIGEKLHMRMDQRSGDMPIGVPSNMIQYAALLLMMCQVTGYEPGNYVHSFADAHVYEDQLPKALELVRRTARPFPILKLDPNVRDLFAFRAEHFTIEEYDPHPAISFPYRP